jgi:cysteine desulfurase
MKDRIYLDNSATTMVDPSVVARMVPAFTTAYGNPSSTVHSHGCEAAQLVDDASQSVAALVGAISQSDIVFTSGATESNDLAILGVTEAVSRVSKKHVITTKIEHPSVLATCERFECEGGLVTYLDVSGTGLIDPEDVRRAIRPETVLISVMAANNEVGTIQPIERVAEIAREHRVTFHTDATQFAGSGALDVLRTGIDLASFSAHKLYGPKGIGALYVRRSSRPVRIVSRLNGGGQQGGLRPGTINVPGVVGFGAASELSRERGSSDWTQIQLLRDRLLRGLRRGIPGLTVNGCLDRRIAPNLNVSIEGISSVALISAARSIAFSAGSACSTGSGKTSHVLAAMGLSPGQAKSSVRFGIGRFNTEAEIDFAIETITASVARLRAGIDQVAVPA